MFIKNNNLFIRKEGENYLFYDKSTRNIIIMSQQLFELWNNIDNLKNYLNSVYLSEVSLRNVIEIFKNNNLIIEEDVKNAKTGISISG